MSQLHPIPVSELQQNVFHRHRQGVDADHRRDRKGRQTDSQHHDRQLGRAGPPVEQGRGLCLYSPRSATPRNLSTAPTPSPCVFLAGEKMQELKYLGTASGRDEDKIAKSGLTLTHIDGVPCFEEATTVLLCRKMYVQTLREDCFIDRAVMESSYPQRDFHDLYVAEIMKVLVK